MLNETSKPACTAEHYFAVSCTKNRFKTYYYGTSFGLYAIYGLKYNVLKLSRTFQTMHQSPCLGKIRHESQIVLTGSTV
jgi:hypothetical protein